MANWPATLPRPLDTSASYTPKFENRIYSQMDVGYRSRQIATHVPMNADFTLRMDGDQFKILTAFYLANDTFTWVDFGSRTEPAATYRFRSQPSQQFVTGSFDDWDVPLQLELISSPWRYGF